MRIAVVPKSCRRRRLSGQRPEGAADCDRLCCGWRAVRRGRRLWRSRRHRAGGAWWGVDRYGAAWAADPAPFARAERATRRARAPAARRHWVRRRSRCRSGVFRAPARRPGRERCPAARPATPCPRPRRSRCGATWSPARRGRRPGRGSRGVPTAVEPDPAASTRYRRRPGRVVRHPRVRGARFPRDANPDRMCRPAPARDSRCRTGPHAPASATAASGRCAGPTGRGSAARPVAGHPWWWPRRW